tara:strand:+ start:9354 stop:9761 length:408 start_codon:yes stop_codon:yes gene_type:complete
MEKYYTPEIEEFHVGFEYQNRQPNNHNKGLDWYKQVYKSDSIRFVKLACEIYEGSIRVKHLDKEDIESLGFKLDSVHNDVRFNYLMFPYRIDHIPHQNRIDIYKWGDECDMIGYITIKNKSELRKLLKQLEIIKE